MQYVEYLGAAVLFWRSYTEPKETVLDPMLTVVKLAALRFEPAGTKIWMREFAFDYDPPARFQGFYRRLGFQGHENLRVFGETIEKAVFQYKDAAGESREAVSAIFAHAVKGLEKLQATYPNSNTSEAAKNWINLLKGQVEVSRELAISPTAALVKEGWRVDLLKDFVRWFHEADQVYESSVTSTDALKKLQSTQEKIKTLMSLKQLEFEEILHNRKL